MPSDLSGFIVRTADDALYVSYPKKHTISDKMAIQFQPIPSEAVDVSGEGLSYEEKKIPRYKVQHMLNFSIENIEELANIALYKYMSVQNISAVLKENRLFIDRIKSWEDCYENFFLKEKFMKNGQEIGADTIIDGVFGQSWTTEKESDALWRIYSKDKKGVRIKTNAFKLFTTFFIDETSLSNTWFGKVRYGSMRKFTKEVRQQIKSQQFREVFQDTFPETEFMKRKEFKHEKEFRVVVVLDSDHSDNILKYKRLSYKINADDFIEEFCLDPRLNYDQVEALTDELKREGANPQKIIQSQLYLFKPVTINLK